MQVLQSNDFSDIREKYGTEGQKAAKKIAKVLKDCNLKYQYKNGEFTISASQTEKENLESSLSKCNFSGWFPELDRKQDSRNDFVIKLTSVNPAWKKLKLNLTIKDLGYSLDKVTAVEVPQGYTVIGQFSKSTTDIQTYGLGPCIAVCLYDPTTKLGSVSHVDSFGKAKSLNSVVNMMKIKGVDPKNIRVTIVGGSESNRDTHLEIQETLEKIGLHSIKSMPTSYQAPSISSSYKKLENGGSIINNNSSRAVNLDLSNGKVSLYSENVSFNNDKSIKDDLTKKSRFSQYFQDLKIEDRTK